MKQRELDSLIEALGPVIGALINKATSYLAVRVEKAENRVKELEARPVSDLVKEMIAAAPQPSTATTTMEIKIDGEELKKIIDTSLKDVRASLDPAVVSEQISGMIAVKMSEIKVPTAEEVARLVPAGRDADMAAITAQIEIGVEVAAKSALPTLVNVAMQDLPLMPTAEEVARFIPVPQNGKSITLEEIQPLIEAGIKEILNESVKIVREAVAEIPAVSTLEEIVAKIPVPENGKDVDPEAIKAMVAEAVSKIELPQAPTAAEVAALIPAPEKGKDADPALILAEVQNAVKEAVSSIELPAVPTAENIAALIPKPKNGKDADQALIKVLIDEALANIDMPDIPTIDEVVSKVLDIIPKPRDGTSFTIEEATPTLLLMVNEAVVKRVAEIPRIVQDGKDADPEVTKKLVTDAVAAAMPKAEDILRLIPVPKDGKSVEIKDVQTIVDKLINDAIEKMPKPKDGVDGADVIDLIINRDGELIATLSNGKTKNLGPVVGKDGQPGFGFEDMEVEDGTTSYKIRFKRGDKVKEWEIKKPTFADSYRDVWKKGVSYERGDVVTWGGSSFLAKKDTVDEPGTSDAWKLFTKRGQNGKDHTGGSTTPSTVKLK